MGLPGTGKPIGAYLVRTGAGVRGGFTEWPRVREKGAGDSSAPCSRNHQYCMDHGGPMDPFLPRDAKHSRY